MPLHTVSINVSIKRKWNNIKAKISSKTLRQFLKDTRSHWKWVFLKLPGKIKSNTQYSKQKNTQPNSINENKDNILNWWLVHLLDHEVWQSDFIYLFNIEVSINQLYNKQPSIISNLQYVLYNA